MAVNFALLDAGPSIGQRFMMGQQEAQAEAERNMLRQAQMQQMAAQQENLMAQREQRALMADERRMKMEEASQRQQFLGELEQKLAEGNYKLDRPTLGKMYQFGLRTGHDSLIKLATEGLRALDEEDLFRQESARFGVGGAPAAPATPAAAAPVNALAQGFSREQVQNMLTSPSARIRSMGAEIAKTIPKETGYTPSSEIQAYELAKSQGYKGTILDFKREMAIAGRPPGPPKEPSKAVEVVDPNDPSKIIIVSAEEAIRRNLTPARAQEGLTVKERQSREAKYPQATSAVKTFETASDNLVNDLQTLINHPGLKSITGIAAGRLPGITEEGREAQALYDKIVARGGFQELQNMRQASPTGGALGNVSNREGDQLKQAFAAIDRTQNADSVKKAARAAIKQIQASKQNVREAYDLTYEYRQGASGAAAPDTGNVAAERAAAKDAISKGAPADAVRRRFKEKTGQEL